MPKRKKKTTTELAVKAPLIQEEEEKPEKAQLITKAEALAQAPKFFGWKYGTVDVENFREKYKAYRRWLGEP